jgi:hypothetical protein
MTSLEIYFEDYANIRLTEGCPFGRFYSTDQRTNAGERKMRTPNFTTISNLTEITAAGWYKLVDSDGIYRGCYRRSPSGRTSLVSSLGIHLYEVETCQVCGEQHPR